MTYWKIAHGIRFTGMPAFGVVAHAAAAVAADALPKTYGQPSNRAGARLEGRSCFNLTAEPAPNGPRMILP